MDAVFLSEGEILYLEADVGDPTEVGQLYSLNWGKR